MTTNPLTVQIRTIKLLEFKYDRTFKAAEGTPIQFNVEVKHRIPTKTSRLEVTVVITYTEKNTETLQPLVSAECLTVYQLEGVGDKEEHSGKEIVSIPEELMKKLFAESIAHCRALLAAQTLGTTFGGTHVEINTNLSTQHKVEI